MVTMQEAQSIDEVFQKRIQEGYTDVSFGRGGSTIHNRTRVFWAFYHPNGTISAYETPTMDCGPGSLDGESFVAEYSPSEFQKHIQKSEIELRERISLKSLLEKGQASFDTNYFQILTDKDKL